MGARIGFPAPHAVETILVVALRTGVFSPKTRLKQEVQAGVIVGELFAEVLNGVLHNRYTLPKALLAVKGYKSSYLL